MFAAYRNASGPECEAQTIRLANEMRKNRESIKLSERADILSGAYHMYRDEIMSEVGKVLSPGDHLQTFLFLSDGIDVSEKPYLQVALKKLRSVADAQK